ncbi:MAG: hypothetical protein ACRDVM_09865, partial [Acidimicrobiia bacterium]
DCVQVVASGLPLTHGLLGVRRLLAGATAGPVIEQAVLGANSGGGLVRRRPCLVPWFAEGGRRDGSIELAE